MNATRLTQVAVKTATHSADPKRNRAPRNAPAPREIAGTSANLCQTIVRSLLASVLVWAGLSKLGDPVSAYTALLAYQLPAPPILVKLVAIVLPWLELLCGLMLLANFHRCLATLVTSVLFGVFLVVVGQAIVRGLDISCGCFNLAIFGIDETSASARFLESVGLAFGRNLILLAGALYLLGAGKGLPRRDARLP